MRVTFLLPHYPVAPVGGFTVVYTYARALAARGHQVTVVHPGRLWREPLPRTMREFIRRCRLRQERALLRRTPVSWHDVDPGLLSFVPSLAVRHLPSADVLVTTAWQTAELAAGFSTRVGRPISLLQHDETWGGDAARVEATWRLPWPKVVIAQWLADRAAALGVRDVEVIRNGLDHSSYRVLSPVADRPLRVAMMYGEQPWKGTAVGLEALAQVIATVPGAEAVVFGTVAPPELPAGVVARQLPDRETLVREIYNGSAVFLCASEVEGWGLPSTEAMACGAALVTTDNLGASEFARDGETALVRQVGDSDALAAAIVSLLRDPALRVRLATAGMREVGGLSWDRSADALEAALLRVAGAHFP